ncbi:MAG: hypothetical protein N3F09_00790 [Bacteroidia bacterium]|nr:hypothetical protein [Bacteroidia bacterium]
MCALLSGLFLLLLFLIRTSAQLITINPAQIFESPWQFSENFLKEKNIYKIHLQILDKKDFQSPQDLNRQVIYEFNKNGKEIFSYTIEPVGTVTQTFTIYRGKRRKIPEAIEKSIPICDTVTRITSHLPDGNIKFFRTYKKNSFALASYFTYHSNGFVKELRCKEWPKNPSPKEYILEKQEILYTDSFQWVVPSEKFRKKVFFNTDKTPYKEQHYEYEDGKLKIIRDVFISAPWIEQYKKFEYTDGRIKKALMYANSGIPVEYEYEYQYDARGNLYTIYYRKNKFLEKEIGFVNDTVSGNAHSIVIRDYLTKSIQIVRIQIYSGKSPFAEK